MGCAQTGSRCHVVKDAVCNSMGARLQRPSRRPSSCGPATLSGARPAVLALLACACTSEPGVDPRSGAVAAVQAASADVDIDVADVRGEVRSGDEELWRVGQRMDGVRVLGAGWRVHVEAGGEPAVSGRYLDPTRVDTRPVLSAEEARLLAGLPDARAELWVDARFGKPRLVWDVQSVGVVDGPGGPTRPVVRVDSLDGTVISRFEGLRHASPPVGDGAWFMPTIGEHSGHTWVPVWVDRASQRAWHENVDAGYAVFDDDTQLQASRAPGVAADPMVVDVERGMTATFAYLQREHAMDGLDGQGGPGLVTTARSPSGVVPGFAHVGSSYENAYWEDGAWFGDGLPGASASWASLDVVAHELGHGVTEYAADLLYEYESGAVNEAYSDVMGAVVQRFVEGDSPRVWTIAEDVVTPGDRSDALRYMSEPTRDGESADHYAHRYLGDWDNGGVHWNSGIGNLAFYLMSEGGRHPTYGGARVPAIGADAAMRIWLRALRFEMMETDDFLATRAAQERAAVTLFGAGSPQVRSVSLAWRAVGVGAARDACLVGRHLTGALAEGEIVWAPSETGFAFGGGTLETSLFGTPGTDFDLFLQAEMGGVWITVATSANAWSEESVSFQAAAGQYRWSITSYAGAGNFTLCGEMP